MTPELRDFARRLADALKADPQCNLRQATAHYETPLTFGRLASIARGLAAEDAAREQVRAAGCTCPEPLLGSRGMDGPPRCRLCNTEAPVARAEQAPALDEAQFRRFASHRMGGVDFATITDARSLLLDYESRVVGPLREALACAHETARNYAASAATARTEADKLRPELAAERAAGRRYIELTDMAIACGTNEDPSAENCGQCRACALNERDKLRAALKARPAPATDEERKRLADMLRHCAESGGASNTVPVRADDLRRIATLLEEPPRRHARKSLGRRFVLRFEDGEISTRTHYDLQSAEVCASAAGAEIIACDLVPVEGEP